MARIGRFVVPETPHHVTQRGNRRERVFFSDDDYALYRDLLHEACGERVAGIQEREPLVLILVDAVDGVGLDRPVPTLPLLEVDE